MGSPHPSKVAGLYTDGGMDTKPAYTTSDEYADWINKRIREERVRLGHCQKAEGICSKP